MKFIALFIFLCLFNCCCSSILNGEKDQLQGEEPSNVTSSIENPENYHNLGFTKNPHVKSKVFVNNFEVLPAELKKIILGHLSPKELFYFVQIDEFKEYHKLTTEAFGSSYKFHNIGYYTHRLIRKDDFIIENDIISIFNFTKFTTFLRTFNKYIKTLVLDNSSFRGNELQITLDFLAENCAKTLTKIEIRHIFGTELNSIKAISFPNVQELIIFSNYFRNQTLDLDRTFPNVRRLTVTGTKYTDRTWIERSFTNLTHLHVDIERGYIRETEVVRILEKSPEVISLGLVYATPSMLRIINEHFPKIVNLGIVALAISYLTTEETIYMRNVERFYFEGITFSETRFIDFDNLKELHWNSRCKPEFVFLDLVNRHKIQIESLEIEKTVISNEHLAIISGMTNLQKVTFRFDPEINVTMTANGLLNFIEANEKLSEIHLFDADFHLRQELYRTFNSSNISGTLQTFEPNSDEKGNVFIVKNSRKFIKLGNSKIDLQIFKNRYYHIY